MRASALVLIQKIDVIAFFACASGDVSFSCVVKHKDDGQTKFINPNSQRQDRKIKYWVSIGSIHREQG